MQAQTIPHKKCCRLRRLSIALFFTWCSSILLSELPGEETQKAAPEAAPEEKPPVCLRCNGTAKITCPRCGGSGNLMKDCPTCNGTGKRLCLSCQKYRDKLGPGKRPCPQCKGIPSATTEKTCFLCRGSLTEICLPCAGHGFYPCEPKKVERTCPDCGYVGKVSCPDCTGSPALSALPSPESLKDTPAPAKDSRSSNSPLRGGEGQSPLPRGEGQSPLLPGGNSKAQAETLNPGAAAGEEAAGSVVKVEAESLSPREEMLKEIEDIKAEWFSRTLPRLEEIQASMSIRQVLNECLELITQLSDSSGARENKEIDDRARQLKSSIKKLHENWSAAMELFEKLAGLQQGYETARKQIKEPDLDSASLMVLEAALRIHQYHTKVISESIKKFDTRGIMPQNLLKQLDERKLEISTLIEEAGILFAKSSSRLPSKETTAESVAVHNPGDSDSDPAKDDSIAKTFDDPQSGSAELPPSSPPGAGKQWIKAIAIILTLAVILIPLLAWFYFRRINVVAAAVKVDAPSYQKHRQLPRPPVRRLVG